MTENKRRGIAAQYKARVSCKVIAYRFNTSPQTVSRIAIEEGCPSRKLEWANLIGMVGNSGLAPMIRRRVLRGWPVAKAMSTPPRHYARRAHA